MSKVEKKQAREIQIKIKLSSMLNSIEDKSLQNLLRYVIFVLCGDKLDWEKVYNKMTELMPEVSLQ